MTRITKIVFNNSFVYYNFKLSFQIFLQTLLGLFLASFGIFKVAGDFKNIQFNADLKSKTFENFGSSLSFCSFEHRGKTLAEKFY